MTFAFRRSALAAAALALFSCASGPVDLERAADEVRRTETAFAATMAARDHRAFTSFLADDAIFVGSKRSSRGKAAIAAEWKRFYEKEKAPFSWQPEKIEVIASGELALSSGPVFAPDGKRIGTFNSTWRRESNGAWKIVLDIGCPDCACGEGEP